MHSDRVLCLKLQIEFIDEVIHLMFKLAYYSTMHLNFCLVIISLGMQLELQN